MDMDQILSIILDVIKVTVELFRPEEDDTLDCGATATKFGMLRAETEILRRLPLTQEHREKMESKLREIVTSSPVGHILVLLLDN